MWRYMGTLYRGKWLCRVILVPAATDNAFAALLDQYPERTAPMQTLIGGICRRTQQKRLPLQEAVFKSLCFYSRQ